MTLEPPCAMSFFQLRTCTLTPQFVSHEHSFHQLILATSGCTELSIEGRGERITRERGCIIPTAYHHDYQGDGNNQTLVLDVPLANLTALTCAGEIERLFERPRFFSVPRQLQDLAESMATQVEHYPALQSEIAALILRAIYQGLHDARLPEAMPEFRSRERLDLARIDAYIDTHLADTIRVERLAELCAMSVGHFHACFRDATGLTPSSHVQLRRLDHARALVRTSELPLGQIALMVGFRDQGSFTRAYRRRFDVPPLADRRGLNVSPSLV